MIMSQWMERDIPLHNNNQNITTNASNSNTTMIDRDTSSDFIAKCDTNINSTLSLDGHCDGERGPPSLCEGAPPQLLKLGTATSTAANTPTLTTLETNATTNVTATTSAKFRKAKSTSQLLTNRANYKRLPLQSNREYTTVTTDEEVECGSSSSSSEDSDDIEDGEEVEQDGSDELDFSEDDLSQEEEGNIECDEGMEPSHDCHAAALERHRRYMYFQDSDSSDEEDNTNDVDTDDDDDSQEDLSEEEMISSDEESDVEPLEEEGENELESDDDEESIDASCYYERQQHLEEEEEEDFYTDYDQYDYNDDDELMENYHGTPPHQHPHFSSNSFQHHDLYLPRGMEMEYELLKYDSDEDSSCSSSSNDEDEESGEYVGVNQAFPNRRYMIQRGGGYGYRPRMWDGSSSSSSALSRQRQSNAIVERTISPSTINSSDDEEEQTDQVPTSSTTTTKTSVTFNTKVTIHPIYETKPPIYPPQILDQIYTNRDELRLNKLRNKKEYAYDNHDWRMCTEEEGMEVDLITGECVHPVHGESECSGSGSIVGSGSRVPIVQTYSSAWGGYHHSSCNDDDDDDEEENTASNLSCSSSNRVIVHRAKRMRMYYP